MKPLKLTFAFLTALVAFLPLPTLAQATSGTITLRRVPLESSLSSNTVRLFAYSPAIAQDTNHLWIGTAGGNVNLNTTGAAGANGAAGTLWYTGAGTPGAGLGTNADLYLDTATGNVYSRPGGTWGLIASIKGSTGAVGTAGATGATGTAGAAGTAGATGATGTQGPIGTTGATGATGTAGATGAAGTNGTNGAAATIAAGTTTTLAAGASATVTNTGTSSAATFNFGVPQGTAGTNGAAGATGPTGATGATGPAPAGTDTQTLRYNGTSLFANSAILNNGAQIALGGAIDTTSRLSVNPQGTAENGLTVNMPSGATGNALTVKDSVGNPLLRFTPSTGELYIQKSGDIYAYLDINFSGHLPVISANQPMSFQCNGNTLEYFSNDNTVTFPTYLRPFKITNQSFGATGNIISSTDVFGAAAFTVGRSGSVRGIGGVTAVPVASPPPVSITNTGIAGTTTYAYRVSAVSGTGETLASTEVTTSTGNAVLSGSNYNYITYTGIAGAETYNIYGRIAGAEQKIGSSAWNSFGSTMTFNDTGAATPSGALPASNTTGYVNASLFQANGAAGLTVTVPLAKLTTGGTNGSLTYTGGILTSATNPT